MNNDFLAARKPKPEPEPEPQPAAEPEAATASGGTAAGGTSAGTSTAACSHGSGPESGLTPTPSSSTGPSAPPSRPSPATAATPRAASTPTAAPSTSWSSAPTASRSPTGARERRVAAVRDIIFSQQIWTPERAAEGWRFMEDRGSTDREPLRPRARRGLLTSRAAALGAAPAARVDVPDGRAWACTTRRARARVASRRAAQAGDSARRTPFERDRARVVHSAALRRLAAKTQVVGPAERRLRPQPAHPHPRGRAGRPRPGPALGCDPDVVETAALAHDLGHPPFGHNGERALDELREACGGFEGNAQTLRILTRLEAKTFDADGRSAGLNLTRATLDAAHEVPLARADAAAAVGAHADGTPRAVRKFGVYDDDLPVFDLAARRAPPGGRQCLEAQVMDLADDVAYSVHDVEDGIVAGRIDLDAGSTPGLRRGLGRRSGSGTSPVADDRARRRRSLRMRAIGRLARPRRTTGAGPRSRR